MDLMGTTEIAELLGVSRARADQLVRQKGFPDPAGTINKRTRVWNRADVEQWAKDVGRTVPENGEGAL